jgi:hypothetical protein
MEREGLAVLLLRAGGLPMLRATYMIGLFPWPPDCTGLNITAETGLAGCGEEGPDVEAGRRRDRTRAGSGGGRRGAGGGGGRFVRTGCCIDSSVRNSQSFVRVAEASLLSAATNAVANSRTLTLVTLASSCSAPAAFSTAKLLDRRSEKVLPPPLSSRETSVDLGIPICLANCCKSTHTPVAKPPGSYRNKVRLTVPNSAVSTDAFHAAIAM